MNKRQEKFAKEILEELLLKRTPKSKTVVMGIKVNTETGNVKSEFQGHVLDLITAHSILTSELLQLLVKHAVQKDDSIAESEALELMTCAIVSSCQNAVERVEDALESNGKDEPNKEKNAEDDCVSEDEEKDDDDDFQIVPVDIKDIPPEMLKFLKKVAREANKQ